MINQKKGDKSVCADSLDMSYRGHIWYLLCISEDTVKFFIISSQKIVPITAIFLDQLNACPYTYISNHIFEWDCSSSVTSVNRVLIWIRSSVNASKNWYESVTNIRSLFHSTLFLTLQSTNNVSNSYSHMVGWGHILGGLLTICGALGLGLIRRGAHLGTYGMYSPTFHE